MSEKFIIFRQTRSRKLTEKSWQFYKSSTSSGLKISKRKNCSYKFRE